MSEEPDLQGSKDCKENVVEDCEEKLEIPENLAKDCKETLVEEHPTPPKPTTEPPLDSPVPPAPQSTESQPSPSPRKEEWRLNRAAEFPWCYRQIVHEEGN